MILESGVRAQNNAEEELNLGPEKSSHWQKIMEPPVEKKELVKLEIAIFTIGVNLINFQKKNEWS